jgi:hypothetical protein
MRSGSRNCSPRKTARRWKTPSPPIQSVTRVYAKNEKENLTDADKKEIRKIIESLSRTN